MNKREFVAAIAEECEVPKSTVNTVLDCFTEVIEEVLIEGDKVQIPGFGTFMPVERAARKGRNPATGKSIQIPASTGVRFKVGSKLKSAVKEG